MSHTIDKRLPFFECHICHKVFTSKWGVSCHVKTHQTDRVRFPCPLCPSTFGSKGDRSKHMKRHGGKQYKCEVLGCNAAFKSSSERKNHVRRVHKQSSAPSSPRSALSSEGIFQKPVNDFESVISEKGARSLSTMLSLLGGLIPHVSNNAEKPVFENRMRLSFILNDP